MIIPLQENAIYPRLVFTYDVDERDIAPHGYRGDAVVELAAGESYPVYFYEPEALREELDGRVKSGFGRVVAEPGLVVIPEICVAGMKSSVLELLEVGYFNHLRPCEDRQAAKGTNGTGAGQPGAARVVAELADVADRQFATE